MTTHGSATALEETPHATDKTISDALRCRAQALINDIWIDPQWRSIIRYALETNDPFLADLVRRADARETIIDTIDFSGTPETNEDESTQGKIETLADIICRSGDESAAALFVLMGTLQNSTEPHVLANTAKHLAFTRCGELNVFGMVDTQVGVLEDELAREPVAT